MTAPETSRPERPARGSGSGSGSAELIRLVVRREIVTRVRERSFAISTLITVLILVAAIVIPALLSRGPDRVTIGLTGSGASALRPLLSDAADQEGATAEFRQYDDEAAARAAVEGGDVDAAFVGTDRVIVADELDDTLGSVVQASYRQLAISRRLTEAGIDPARAAQALAIPPLAVDSLEGADSGRGDRRGAAFIGIIFLYGQLIGYGFWVAFGVVEEKSSRVVELLLATLRPWQLLTGKIIGIGLLGLAQFVLIGAVGLAAAVGSDAVSVPSEVVGVLGQVLAWFVLGYAFYSAAYAAAASLVSRQEELQNITGPLTILLVGSFFGATFALQDPDGTFAQVGSLVPPLSVLTMPVRWAGGDAAWWEVGLAAGLMLVVVVGLVRVAGWVYAGAVLQTGPRVAIREALTAGRRGAR